MMKKLLLSGHHHTSLLCCSATTRLSSTPSLLLFNQCSINKSRQFHYGRVVFSSSSSSEDDQSSAHPFRFLQRGLKLASPKLIILMGPPGAGKGTQSRLITAECPSYHIISAGDTLREESQTNPQLKELLASGKLAPEEETAKYLLKKMNSIYKEYYEQYVTSVTTPSSSVDKEAATTGTTPAQEVDQQNQPTKDGPADLISTSVEQQQTVPSPNFILEGYPRNLIQTKQFLTWFTGGDIHFSKHHTIILHLLVDKECIKERLKGRLIHDKSGRTYHVEFRKPKVDSQDDVTGEPLSKRDDDLNDEAIANRMETYKSQTLPTLELLIDNEFEVVDVTAIEHDIEKVRSKVFRNLIERGYLAKPKSAPPNTGNTTVGTTTPASGQMAGKSKEIQAQKAAARESGSKGKKKKWSKSRVKEKLNNKVLFDTKSFNQLVKEVPKMKLITIARVSEALGVTGSVAKKGLRYLEEKDLIKPVVKHSNMMVYVVKKEETAEAPKEETKPSKKESKKEKQ
ncbi:hypothetical protein C9374_009285 [Naegleria lovaniensis]|uniref:Adenylate kinase active site lid domain-containing protein n=1 Tax=Naegleria lovaniensis TaxID=51637 RepID=A0AA88GH31_NAELO|nr:uncharacterized protein C9374_009285 [Naegleria lovaniensis]KAG2377374.1 hypothetical protein C9374_009285 [Naegleria lovaniensis]